MFTEVQTGARRRRILPPVLAHCALLVWLLHAPPPVFIAPSSVMAGVGGSAVTHLYWTGGPAQESAPSRSREQEQTHLIYRRHRATPSPERKMPEKAEQLAARATQQAPPAGSPYGSLLAGPTDGHEVRPALPVVSFDPVIGTADLPDGMEGSVIIEITIDEAGNVVQKMVVQSLTPAIDSKVMAAVSQWHFSPATRDGVAIASKQDVYYHFPLMQQQQYRR